MVIKSNGVAERSRTGAWTSDVLRSLGSSVGTGLVAVLGLIALVTIGSRARLAYGLTGGWGNAIIWFLVCVVSCAFVSRYSDQTSYAIPPLAEPGTIERSGDVLHIQIGGRRHSVRRGDVVAGWFGTSQGLVAVLRTRSHTFFLRVPDRRTGERLLAVAGVGSDQRVFAMRLQRASRRSWLERFAKKHLGDGIPGRGTAAILATALLAWAFASALDETALWRAGVAALVFAVTLLRPLLAATTQLHTRVTIGADGLAIQRWGRTEHLAHTQIDHFAITGSTVVVALTDGREIVLGAATDSAAQALRERLQSAHNVAARRALPAADLEQLDRKGRPVRDWLDAVRRLASAAGGYRESWLRDHDLAEVIADAHLTPERRIAAAAALSVKDDPDARDRVRIALEACADEPLREAIEKAMEGELEAAAIEQTVTRRARGQ